MPCQYQKLIGPINDKITCSKRNSPKTLSPVIYQLLRIVVEPFKKQKQSTLLFSKPCYPFLNSHGLYTWYSSHRIKYDWNKAVIEQHLEIPRKITTVMKMFQRTFLPRLNICECVSQGEYFKAQFLLGKKRKKINLKKSI